MDEGSGVAATSPSVNHGVSHMLDWLRRMWEKRSVHAAHAKRSIAATLTEQPEWQTRCRERRLKWLQNIIDAGDVRLLSWRAGGRPRHHRKPIKLSVIEMVLEQ
jgi:hypothetical protein